MTDTARMRATEALPRHAPELVDVDVRDLGRGLDHVVFVAADLVLRVADGRSVQREAALLESLPPGCRSRFRGHASLTMPACSAIPSWRDDPAGW